MNRREFMFGSAAAAATLAGLGPRALAAVRGARRLRLGVVSDTHVSCGNLSPEDMRRAAETLVKALRWFDAQGVDAVAIPGDLSETGSMVDVKAFGDAWRTAFPGGKGADGRPVEHLLVTGNHDNYMAFRKGQPSLYDDIRANWKATFGEDYDEVRVKTVKGVDFVLAGWRSCDADYQRAAREVGAKGGPFFFVRHMHPKGTCHGPYAWGHDGGGTTGVLSAFPNAIALSGHSHYALTDERTVWQGGFTSIGCGSLSYLEGPSEDYPPLGAENGDIPYRAVDVPYADGVRQAVNDAKLMKNGEGFNAREGKQGMVIDVYENALVIRRHEFVFDQDLGETWEVSLPARRGSAFDPKARRDLIPACEFAAGAKLSRRDDTAKTRDGISHEAIMLTVPAGAATTGAPLVGYDVGYMKGEKFAHLQFVVAGDFHLPACKKLATMEIPVRRDRVPDGARLAVRPLDCFVRAGATITL